MLDLTVLALVLCCIIGLISSVLLTASFFVYRMATAKRCDTGPKVAEGAAVAAASASAVEALARPEGRVQKRDRGDVIVVKEEDTTSGSASTTSYTSCEECSQSQSQAGSALQQQQALSSWSETTGTAGVCGDRVAIGSAGLYTCEVCGSCCAGDGRKSQLTYRPIRLDRFDGELTIDDGQVQFRRCRAGVGAFYFQRAVGDIKELQVSLSATAGKALSLLAEIGTIYDLIFCASSRDLHSKSLNSTCPDCQSVLQFELIDSSNGAALKETSGKTIEVLFHHGRRLQQNGPDSSRRVWTVVQLVDAAATKSSAMTSAAELVYRGLARKLHRVARLSGLRLVLQLCLQGAPRARIHGRQRRTSAPPYVEAAAMALSDWDDQSGQGDSYATSPPASIADGQRMDKRRRHQRSWPKNSANDSQIGDVAVDVWNADSNSCSPKSAAANTQTVDAKSNQTSQLSTIHQSPLSMGSMRRAVRWPITQMESLMETSSSSTNSVSAALLDRASTNQLLAGDVSIQLEEDEDEDGLRIIDDDAATSRQNSAEFLDEVKSAS